MVASTHHSPPEGVSVAAEISASVITDIILLSEVDKIRREDEAQETNVQRCNQLLLTTIIISIHTVNPPIGARVSDRSHVSTTSWTDKAALVRSACLLTY